MLTILLEILVLLVILSLAWWFVSTIPLPAAPSPLAWIKWLLYAILIIIAIVVLLKIVPLPGLSVTPHNERLLMAADTTPIPTFTLTPEFLGMLAGVLLSLAFSYVPGLNSWYAGQDATFKRLTMLLLLAISAASIYGLSCASILGAVTCDRTGLIQIVWTFVLAVVANQSTFTISPVTSTVAKAAAK